MTTSDRLGGIRLPGCPFNNSAIIIHTNSSIVFELPFPAITLPSISISFLSIYFCLFIYWSFCSLRLFNRPIIHPSLNNWKYSLYFGLCSIGYFLDHFRYAYALEESHDDALLIISAVLRCMACLFLLMAMDHTISFCFSDFPKEIGYQISPRVSYHASTAIQITNTPVEEDNETTPFFDPMETFDSPLIQPKTSFLMRWIYAWKRDSWFIFLTFGHLMGILIQSWNHGNLYIFSVYLFTCLTQKMSLWTLVYRFIGLPSVLILSGNRRRHGPSLFMKCLLFCSLFCLSFQFLEPSISSHAVLSMAKRNRTNESIEDLVCVLPPYWWNNGDYQAIWGIQLDSISKKVHSGHGWASYVDLMAWTGYLGQILLFFFVRACFLVQKEEWTWIMVSHLQNTFNF